MKVNSQILVVPETKLHDVAATGRRDHYTLEES